MPPSLPPDPVADAAPAPDPVADAAPASDPVAGAGAAPPSELARPAASEPAPASASVSAPASGFGGPPWLTTALAVVLPAIILLLLPPLSRSGLWDPYELNIADLGRRLSLNLFQAGALALSGADNSMPHLNDLGRPELPFTSIALGFKLFGLHEWSGRLPLALWGMGGALALYAAVARLVDKRAALYSTLALCTMPLFFVQARSMLGDIVTMSGVSMALSGLSVFVFDRREPSPHATRARMAFLALGAAGLIVGYYSRGALLGLGVPLGTIGGAWILTLAAGRHQGIDRLGDLAGVLALAGLLYAALSAVKALEAGDTKNLSMALGAMIRTPARYPTFDVLIGHLGHGLAPWSAFIPFAIGRLFIAPASNGKEADAYARDRESYFRAVVLVGAAVAFTVHGFLAVKTELIAFSGPAILAAACGIAIRDFERGAHASIALGVGTAVLLGVFHHDFHELPEKAYQAFAVTGASFPESFKEHALALWTVALVGFAGLALLSWAEHDSKRRPFDVDNYLRILDALRDAWDGLLALVYFALVAGASLAGLAIWVGSRLHAKWLPTISMQVREGALNAWWVTALVPLVAIFGLFFASDLWLWAFGRAGSLSWGSFTRGFEPLEELFVRIKEEKDRTKRFGLLFVLLPLMILAAPVAVFGVLLSQHLRLPVVVALALPAGVALFLVLGLLGELLRGRRAAGFVFLGTILGVVLSGAYYPALANQLSPKEVFESYERTHERGEPLALFGVGGRTAAYYAGGEPPSFADAQSAYQWLVSGSEGRRFLAMRADELSRLNQIYRERVSPRQNLPVLDARSSQILLVSSRLLGSEKNQNPLDKMLLAAPPAPQHPLDVNMDDKLAVLGFDLIDKNGDPVKVVAPGRKYRMRTYYKVLGPVTTEWEAFIHIDGYRRRHNGDHKPMEGKYPFSLWLRDDLLVDDYEFSLEPNFSPGTYTIYFGLFVGDTRLKIKSGPSDGDNRINGGPLVVQ
ncbi:ArnT family glycosyltransferase [Pendulispora albinea]|uniref:Glycosyltransferase family 39 protein n=1 Tax=Pendulispora albinea TaxID=2741071 RepID=A0ABZ2LJ80_9BACT